MSNYADPIVEPIHVDNGKKEAVLYFHGCSSTPAYFKPYVDECVAKGYDVYGPLYRGHGTKVEEMLVYGWKEWQEDARNAIEPLLKKYDKIHILGHSLGGALTTYVAGLYANTGKIGKILIMCPGYGLANHDFYTMDYDKIGKNSFPFLSGKVYAPELVQYAWSYSSMYMKTVQDLILNGPNCMEQVKNITSPVWYMLAEKDPICDVAQQKEIARQIPNLVDYHVFQESGHNILNDCEYKDAMKRVKMWINA